MKNLKWKWLFIFIVVAIAIWQLHYSFIFFSKDKEEFSKIPQSKQKVIKSRALHLGLDLQGGMHLVMEIDKSKLKEEELKGAINRALEIIRNRVDELGVTEPEILKQGTDRIMVQLPGVVDRERAREIIGKTALLEFKLVREPNEMQNILNRVNETLKAIEGDTFDLFSYFPPAARAFGIMSPYKTYIDSLLELPKVQDQIPKYDTIQWGKEVVLEGYKYYPLYILKNNALLTGSSILDATLGVGTQYDPMGYRIDLTMSKEYWREWARHTGMNLGRRIAIVLDGIVQSAPTVRDEIRNGKSQITMGNATMEEAKTLAIILKAGALPAPLKIVEERSIGPSLGNDSIRAGTRALIVGAILVFLFMVVYYLKGGLVAILALILNLIFLLAVLSGLRATLTLPGLAGIVLTVGAAIDANVLIFERIREELKSGKTIRTAIVGGYQKVFSTILDANTTTFIAAIILFYFGTGPIKGFAVTLSIGLAASFFTAIFVTRNLFEFWILKGLKNLPMLSIFKNPNYDFLKIKKVAFIISGVLILSGIVSVISHGGLNYGVDFTGGSILEIQLEGKPVSSQEIRTVLSKAGFGGATIQKYGEKNLFLVKIEEDPLERIKNHLKKRFPEKKLSFPEYEIRSKSGYLLEVKSEEKEISSKEIETALSEIGFKQITINKDTDKDLVVLEIEPPKEDPLRKIRTEIVEGFSSREVTFPRQEVVGPAISRGLQSRAAWVVLLGMIGILIYVSIRFTFRFGIAAVIALFHDLVLTTGILSITNTEFSIPIIAGLLTILGYSINDSIVISDRIRENMRLMRGKPFGEIINSSINQTLARTIITSITTLFVLISLFFFGGRILHGFSLTLLVGVLIGTYSSIFIVAPIVAEWEKKAPSRKR